MKKMILMMAVVLGCMTAFAQKVDKNEAKALKAFLAQPAEKDASNAQALKVTDLNALASIEGVTVENGHVTAIDWKDKKIAGNLDLSGFTALQKVDVSRNSLTGLSVAGDAALVELNASRNVLKTLDVSGTSALQTLTVYKNRLTDIDVSQSPVITNLNVSNNYFDDLYVDNYVSLNTLN